MKWKNYLGDDGQKVTGVDKLPGDVLLVLGEDGLRIVTQLISKKYQPGEWSKDFSEVKIIAYKKKPKATKCTDHCTIKFIAQTAKRVARIYGRWNESKIEDERGGQFGFSRGKFGFAIETLRIISERSLDIDEEFCS